MTEYVRVKDKETKAEKSIPVDASLDGWDVLKDKPATNASGEPLPDKPHQPLSHKSGQQTGTEKEN